MARLIHISDLHFGTEEPELVAGFLKASGDLRPDLIVASGDFTQEAASREYTAAAAFLQQLAPTPVVVTCGNHDVPSWQVHERLFCPFRRYERHILPHGVESVGHGPVVVDAVNSARAFRWGLDWSHGRINKKQIYRLLRRFRETGDDAVRVVVTHHPFLESPSSPRRTTIHRRPLFFRLLEHARVDLLLAGHFHHSYSDVIDPARFGRAGSAYGTVSIQAGTVFSKRLKAEKNSFNAVTIDSNRIKHAVYGWDAGAGAFVEAVAFVYGRGKCGWQRAEP